MSLSSTSKTNSTSTFFIESIDSPHADIQPFTPGQCLLCSNLSPSFADSVLHMQKSHGLFIPHHQHLAVDLETLFRYLHLVIFGYRECIQCGTERATIQAVQQHMIGKGHCKFDVSEEDSEFAEFYDFVGLEDDTEGEMEDDGDTRNYEEADISSTRKPLLAGEESIHLPSGKIITKKSSAQSERSFTQLHRRIRNRASQLEYSLMEPDDVEGSDTETLNSDKVKTRTLSKREKREKAMVTYQLTSISANDRNALMHLPAPQQRSLLATQHRHTEKTQKEDRRRQSRIERKGNKNLYAYWATETPIYQCG